MPNWDTMPLQFYTGLSLAVAMIVVAIVVPIILSRMRRGTTARLLESRDRASMEEARRLHEFATSASMAAVAGAQRSSV
jgi:flagellar biosynthesis/type III secretory pathway M-ring protein FliF/YscJ